MTTEGPGTEASAKSHAEQGLDMWLRIRMGLAHLPGLSHLIGADWYCNAYEHRRVHPIGHRHRQAVSTSTQANRMTHGSPGSGQQQAGAAAPQLPGAFRRKLPEGPPGCTCRPQPAAGEPVRCPGSTARVGGGVAARQLPLHG